MHPERHLSVRAKLATVVSVGLLALWGFAAAARADVTHLSEGSFGSFSSPAGVGVDDATGDIYVIDVEDKTVTRFDDELHLKEFSALGTAVIDGHATEPCSGVSPNCDQTPQNGFSFDRPNAAQVVIDNSGNPLTDGNIYISDSFHQAVDIFAPSGAYLGQLTKSGAAGPTFGETCGVAVGPTGDVFSSDYGGGKIHRFVPTTNPPTDADFVEDFISESPCEVAAGASSTAGALFVNRWQAAVFKYDALGQLQYSLGSEVQGLTVSRATGNVFTVSGDAVFEYDASGVAGAILTSSFGTASLEKAAGIAVDGTSGRVYVSDSQLGKVFVFGPAIPVAKPSVALGPYTPLSASKVRLTGRINPHGGATQYYFEYGAQDCAVGPCASVPASQDAPAGGDNNQVTVSQDLGGLQPATTYHYRLVAGNSAGTAVTGDATFVTLTSNPPTGCPNQQRRAVGPASHLGECRAYELVSSMPAAQKNGQDILENTQTVRAAVDGGAFEYALVGGAGGTEGASFMSEYMAVRDGAAGWSVHPVTPAQPALSLFDLFFSTVPRYVGEFTPDLSRGVFLAKAPLNGEGANVRDVPNLYLRNDLLAPGAGSYRLLTEATEAQVADQETKGPSVAGASADLSHVLFESERNLTADAASLESGTRLYESVEGAVRMVGILPAPEGGGPTIAQAGQGAEDENDTLRTMSSDGSRIAFTVAESGSAGRLYLRDDHRTATLSDDTSARIDASEKTNGGGPGGTDPNGHQPATFWTATPDLGQIFFTSKEALTDDAPTDQQATEKLYRYDLGAPVGHRLTLLSVDQNPDDGIEDEAEGVIGVADDGSYVYFVGSNQLQAEGPTTSRPRIFVWHDGAVRSVAAINEGKEVDRLLGGGASREDTRWARVTPDGQRLLFVTEGENELTGYDHGDSCPELSSSRCQEVYLYDVQTQSLLCPSCDVITGEAGADADFNVRTPNIFVPRTSYENRAISDDGRFVFFDSGEQLSPYDRNQGQDVYELDTTTGDVLLVSGGEVGVDAHFMDASADGSDVFFATRARLVGSDGDQNVDIYDARVNGGVREPEPPPPACQAEAACRPPAPISPAEAVPESARYTRPSAAKKPHHKKKRKHSGHRRKHRHGGEHRHPARGHRR